MPGSGRTAGREMAADRHRSLVRHQAEKNSPVAAGAPGDLHRRTELRGGGIILTGGITSALMAARITEPNPGRADRN
jgi:hypothetical protein